VQGTKNSTIYLTDSPDELAFKIKRAKTDSICGISYSPSERPEISNLIEIYASLSNQTIESVVSEYTRRETSAFKAGLTEVLVGSLGPIYSRIKALEREDEGKHGDDRNSFIDGILNEGARRASVLADQHMAQVKSLVGLY